MKKLISCFIVMLCLTSIGFCENKDGTYAQDVKERKISTFKCTVPIGTIVASQFPCKAAGCMSNNFGLTPAVIGQGMSDMLLTALSQTGCFTVYDREAMQAIAQEKRLAGIAADQGLKAADFILMGSVTAFDMTESGNGGGGFGLPIRGFGGLAVHTGGKKAHVGIDIRIVRVSDATILVSKAVEGKAERSSFGIGAAGIVSGIPLGGGFQSVQNTPIEEAMRDVLSGGVALVIQDLSERNLIQLVQPPQPAGGVNTHP